MVQQWENTYAHKLVLAGGSQVLVLLSRSSTQSVNTLIALNLPVNFFMSQLAEKKQFFVHCLSNICLFQSIIEFLKIIIIPFLYSHGRIDKGIDELSFFCVPSMSGSNWTNHARSVFNSYAWGSLDLLCWCWCQQPHLEVCLDHWSSRTGQAMSAMPAVGE